MPVHNANQISFYIRHVSSRTSPYNVIKAAHLLQEVNRSKQLLIYLSLPEICTFFSNIRAT